MNKHMAVFGEPKIIHMNQKMYDEIAATAEKYVTFDTKYHPGATVYGMKIRIDNRLENGVMYITDDYMDYYSQEGEQEKNE